MKFMTCTALLTIIVMQITIIQCTSRHQQHNEVTCKQKNQMSRTFGGLDATVNAAREILGTASDLVRHLEETCMKEVSNQAIVDDEDIPTDFVSTDDDSKINTALYQDCADAFHNGVVQSGVYEIQPIFWNSPIKVFCDMKTAGGGWTVLQRRVDIQPREDFYRTWDDYKKGFGNLDQEFWLGNDFIFALSNQENMTLRVDLEDYDNNARFALYDHFRIRPESENYRLVIGAYSEGDAGDALTYSKDMAFSTKDRKNDIWNGNCAESFKGAWWYAECHHANLNGLPHSGNHPSYADGINWLQFKGYNYSLKFTEMKIRPSKFTQSS